MPRYAMLCYAARGCASRTTSPPATRRHSIISSRPRVAGGSFAFGRRRMFLARSAHGLAEEAARARAVPVDGTPTNSNAPTPHGAAPLGLAPLEPPGRALGGRCAPCCPAGAEVRASSARAPRARLARMPTERKKSPPPRHSPLSSRCSRRTAAGRGTESSHISFCSGAAAQQCSTGGHAGWRRAGDCRVTSEWCIAGAARGAGGSHLDAQHEG